MKVSCPVCESDAETDSPLCLRPHLTEEGLPCPHPHSWYDPSYPELNTIGSSEYQLWYVFPTHSGDPLKTGVCVLEQGGKFFVSNNGVIRHPCLNVNSMLRALTVYLAPKL